MSKITYYLSQKWNLSSITDSDGDGTLDIADNAPLQQDSSLPVINIDVMDGNNYVLYSSDPSISIGVGYNPTLNLLQQTSYKFQHNGSSHPFKIVIGSFEEVIAAGESEVITIPADQNASPRYFCVSHPSEMANTIILTDPTLPSIEVIGGITGITQNITIPLIPTGNEIPAGLTFELESNIEGASIIADAGSSSGYSLLDDPPSTLDSYSSKVDVPIKAVSSGGNKGFSSIMPIYFYQENVAYDETSGAPILEILDDSTTIGNSEATGETRINLNNYLSSNDLLGSTPIQYTMDTNSYFSINSTSGVISLINNAFPPSISEIALKVYAQATSNQTITGVYANINISIKQQFDFFDESGNLNDSFGGSGGSYDLPSEFNTNPGEASEYYFDDLGDISFDSNQAGGMFDQILITKIGPLNLIAEQLNLI